jgi:GPI ethanolamine phosphate transferase 2/3 subunit F
MSTLTNTKSPPSKELAPAEPISTLETTAATSYVHVHPALLLSLYFWRFDAIVKDPVAALTSLVFPVAILQLAYVIICLPPTEEGSRTKPTEPKTWVKRKGDKKHADSGLTGKIVVCCVKFIPIELASHGVLY